MSRIDELKNDVRRHPDWAAHKLLKHEQQNAELVEIIEDAISYLHSNEGSETAQTIDLRERLCHAMQMGMRILEKVKGERDE